MHQEIRIPKKHCEEIKSRFLDGYYIVMPKASKFDGYKFYVSSWYCEVNPIFATISNSKNEGFLFTLEKIDKVPGRRYRRPKLSFEEIQAEFAELSTQFYSDKLPQAFAYLKAYANNGTRSAGRVVGNYFCVGGIDNTWFYESDTSRRRLNSNGVCIIKSLLADEEAAILKKKILRLNKLRRIESDYNNCHVDYGTLYYYKEMQRTLTPETFKAITERFEEINALVNMEAKSCRSELKELEQYFDGLLKKKAEENI